MSKSTLWNARVKRNQLFRLIKQVSDENGGDDIEWLREYAKDVFITYQDSLDEAIECFRPLCTGNTRSFNDDKKNSVKTNACEKCGYVAPFCYHSESGICSKEGKYE